MFVCHFVGGSPYLAAKINEAKDLLDGNGKWYIKYIWWKNMVGRDKGSLALHCLVMQLSGTVYSTFKVTNSSKEQRKASNMSTPNLWKRRIIVIQKVAYTRDSSLVISMLQINLQLLPVCKWAENRAYVANSVYFCCVFSQNVYLQAILLTGGHYW